MSYEMPNQIDSLQRVKVKGSRMNSAPFRSSSSSVRFVSSTRAAASSRFDRASASVAPCVLAPGSLYKTDEAFRNLAKHRGEQDVHTRRDCTFIGKLGWEAHRTSAQAIAIPAPLQPSVGDGARQTMTSSVDELGSRIGMEELGSCWIAYVDTPVLGPCSETVGCLPQEWAVSRIASSTSCGRSIRKNHEAG